MDSVRPNLDIFYHIVSYLGTYEALQTSLTCREAHRVATPGFIETVVFPLPWLRLPGAHRSPDATPETYEGFRAYMLAGGSERFGHLKTLDLREDAFCTYWGHRRDRPTDDSVCDFTLAEPLIDVVQGAIGLRRLSIAHTDAIFNRVPGLADAIASLPQLEDVCFHDADTLTLSVLSRMQSRPRKVELHLVQHYDYETEDYWRGHYTAGRVRFLPNFTDSLEVLELSGADIIEDLEPSTVWHAVRELNVMEADLLELYPLARAFPNLRRLRLEARCGDDVLPENHWRELDYVYACDPPFPALQQHVRYLDMGWPIMLSHPAYLSLYYCTMALLQHVKPIILKGYATTELYRLIAEAAPTVRFLRAVAAPGRFPTEGAVAHILSDADARAGLSEMFMLLRDVRLKGLTLDWEHKIPLPWSKKSKWKQFALVIATCIPSLEYIGMRMLSDPRKGPTGNRSPHGKSKPRAYRWYRVIRQLVDDRVRVEKVSDHDGKGIESVLQVFISVW
ncbi:hypothetical protein FOMPIDRAFT_1013774 [Fomitopsis schrenkii]|uniref:F-box domain-containing protein n=1 Tax=Fomitopsis schrenkii TaxID=2126942 RepID=S8FUV0_FOMSC|nr:hypothetical protein FOMPIDRAFT_1013774 [Fomitopsis schrenkii]